MLEKKSVYEPGPQPNTEWVCECGHRKQTWEVGPLHLLPKEKCPDCQKTMEPKHLAPLIMGGPRKNPHIKH